MPSFFQSANIVRSSIFLADFHGYRYTWHIIDTITGVNFLQEQFSVSLVRSTSSMAESHAGVLAFDVKITLHTPFLRRPLPLTQPKPLPTFFALLFSCPSSTYIQQPKVPHHPRSLYPCIPCSLPIQAAGYMSTYQTPSGPHHPPLLSSTPLYLFPYPSKQQAIYEPKWGAPPTSPSFTQSSTPHHPPHTPKPTCLNTIN